jgi:zinc/manganese transport system substrate-binding protein
MLYKWLKKTQLLVVILPLYSNVIYAQINVFACEPEWAALAQELGGNLLKVYSATTAQQDPHHIQARPSLIAKTRRADLVVCTGAELEIGWFPLLLRKSANNKIQPGQPGYFMAAEQVLLLEKPNLLDRSQGDVHASGNPHIHLDPRRIIQIATALADRLIRIDHKNQSVYQKNLDDFIQQWSTAIKLWEQKAQSLRSKRIVVNHNSWIYLESWLKLERIATLEPKPGIAPSSTHLSKVLAKLKQNPADMILYANYQSDKAVQWLATKTRTPVIALPFSVSNGETLFQWFDSLLNRLLEGSL